MNREWEIDLLDELEHDILFINDVARAVAPDIAKGSRSSKNAQILKLQLRDFVHSNNLRMCQGPNGVPVRDEEEFLNRLEASIIEGRYGEVSYSYWVDRK